MASEFETKVCVIWHTALTRTMDERDYRGFMEAHALLEDDLGKYVNFDEHTRNCFKWAVSLLWRDALLVPEIQRKSGFSEAVSYLETLGWKPLP